jgi:ferredoxin
VAFLLFVALFTGLRRGGWDANLVNLPIRLSPLNMLAGLIAGRTIFAGALLGLVLIGLALVAGRAWCGWLCPLGSILDLFPLARWIRSRRRPWEWLRGLKYGLLVAILALAVLGNLSLLVTDPLTIVTRTFTLSLWPPLESLTTAAETGLYQVPSLQNFVGRVDELLRPAIFPFQQLVSRDALLFGLLFVALIMLNFLAERFWCRYLCPLGSLLGLVAKVGLIKRQVNSNCTRCQLCARACPTSTVNANKGFASDPAECTLCMDCLKVCPSRAIDFKASLVPAGWSKYDPRRRAALAVLGTGVVLAGAGKLLELTPKQGPHLLRPPGAQDEGRFLSRCIRCGDCLRICPTNVLQPAVGEAGAAGFGTPVLVPRLGYCDYACNSCGQVCPTEAIPRLGLEEKRRQVIGVAVIDRSRCIPWALRTPCGVCEEMCPLTPKAITLRGGGEGQGEGRGQGKGGNEEGGSVPRPHVDASLCIGCGICEYKCPVEGVSAIRVASI